MSRSSSCNGNKHTKRKFASIVSWIVTYKQTKSRLDMEKALHVSRLIICDMISPYEWHETSIMFSHTYGVQQSAKNKSCLNPDSKNQTSFN